jgi:hypothetical protein
MKFFPVSPGLAFCGGNFGWGEKQNPPALRRVGWKLSATHTPARDNNNSTAWGKFA